MVESIKELRKICYPEGQYVCRPWLNKHIFNKFSIYFTWLFLHTKITANQVTFLEYILVIIGSLFLFSGNLWFILIGLLIMLFTNLLDCVDGEIARYRKKSSIVGVYLEHVFHQLLLFFMFFPLAFGIFFQTGWKSILIFGFLCSILSKSIAIPNVYSAVIESKLNAITDLTNLKQKTSQGATNKDVDLHGSNIGKKLNELYDRFRDFWTEPMNILHLTIISVVELVNHSYQFFPDYIIFYWYLAIYALVVVFIQITSVIVHYKGKTAEQYFKALFGNN